ncbi:hypothetical protein PRIPAC_96232 [Pristionchus pacificus]|uniref:ELM2 domain-containing protein n=1 Tax=Pristionchus pacificus TaxID=54126 RepID=A0A454XXF5_PRIPA|nr:hypothetical protein PRIPAC_96232 [Pristionchus pacificus]|eukprot:PDM66067.1 hypothetical protein PRIPAC_45292 [Pristionchus pacificus]
MERHRMRLLPVMAQDEEYYDDETPAKRKKEKKGKKNQKETTENLFSAAKIMEGPNYQAALPPFQSEPRYSIDDRSEVMWIPNPRMRPFVFDRLVRDVQLKDRKGYDKLDLPIRHRDCDLALFTLMLFDMDVMAARTFSFKTIDFEQRFDEIREAAKERKRKMKEKEEEEKKKEERRNKSRHDRLTSRQTRMKGVQKPNEEDDEEEEVERVSRSVPSSRSATMAHSIATSPIPKEDEEKIETVEERREKEKENRRTRHPLGNRNDRKRPARRNSQNTAEVKKIKNDGSTRAEEDNSEISTAEDENTIPDSPSLFKSLSSFLTTTFWN